MPLPDSIAGLYDEAGKLRSEFQAHRPAMRALVHYHERAANAALAMTNGDYKVPMIVEIVRKFPVIYGQVAHRRPFVVIWIMRDEDGHRKKHYKFCANIGAAVAFHKQIVDRVPNATIVSRARAYHVPPLLRGKLPKPWLWCPRCCKPRKFVVSGDGSQTFFTMKKEWSDEEGRYVPRERRVRLIECPMCGFTNRDPVMRQSNQPWEVRRFKRGVTRAKRRKK